MSLFLHDLTQKPKGLSINDVTALGERKGECFSYNSTKASVIKKRDDGVRGPKNCQKLCDVICFWMFKMFLCLVPCYF